MVTLELLEDNDIIQETDWCRPLQILPMSSQGDYYSFKSRYTGKPENNVEWCKVKHIIGKCWFGRTIFEFHLGMHGYRYEFVRGNIPKTHQIDMENYK